MYLSFVQQLNRNSDSARHLGVVSRCLTTICEELGCGESEDMAVWNRGVDVVDEARAVEVDQMELEASALTRLTRFLRARLRSARRQVTLPAIISPQELGFLIQRSLL